MLKKAIIITTLTILITGCSTKTDTAFNKSAKIWYNKIIKSISNYNLDKADKEFISLESEHRNSPLLKEATLILANAHINSDEHILANYYIDKYIKRFAKRDEVEYFEFLKIKSTFLSFKYPNREQKLLQTTANEIKKFLDNYPNSKYKDIVNSMYSRVFMAQIDINKKISDLYLRIGKKEASKLYQDRVKNSFIKLKDIESAKLSWYKDIFNKM